MLVWSCKEWQKSPNRGTGLGNRGLLKVLNDMYQNDFIKQVWTCTAFQDDSNKKGCREWSQATTY